MMFVPCRLCAVIVPRKNSWLSAQNLPCTLLLQVIRTKDENKARGYGFVSFLDPMDCAKAIREMNGKYLGSR
jgi:RNA recognition motif-containing protein